MMRILALAKTIVWKYILTITGTPADKEKLPARLLTSVAANVTSFANTPPSPGWMSWDVTPDVQAWVSGISNSNYGWQIADLEENAQVEYTTTFYTREYTDTDLISRLVIQYTT